MPEGPEIKRSTDQLANVLAGEVALDVYFGLADLKPFEASLQGQQITGLESRGKALLTHFANGYSIYSHNQLYGVWQTVVRGEMPDTKRSLRLALHTEHCSALLFSASDISVWQTAELTAHPFLARLGPDLLSQPVEWSDIKERLQSSVFRNRSLAALYLDQSFLAGIGNYLRSEILFTAGCHPWAKPSQLSKKVLSKLARASLDVTWQSYRSGGVTNSLARARKLKQQGASFEQRRFKVFGRESEACYECGTHIVNTPVSSRRLYWCPVCQPAPD